MPEIGTMQQINSEPLRTATVLTPQSQAEQYAREAQEAASQAAQSATDAQTAAASAQQAVAGAVKYSEAQTLTAVQQAQARANIGAGDADAEEVADLKSAMGEITGNDIITFTNGLYINTNVNIGAEVSLTPIEGAARNNYAIIDAAEGDRFTINGLGGNAGRLWAFVDASNLLISKAGQNISAEDLVLTAPENASKLVLNALDAPGICFRGVSIAGSIHSLESALGTPTLLPWDQTDKKYIATNGISINPEAPYSTSNSYHGKCTFVACSPGDIFIVSTKGGANYRPYVFCKSNGDIIATALGSNVQYHNERVVAPADAAYVGFNSEPNDAYGTVQVGEYIFETLQHEIDALPIESPYKNKKCVAFGTSLTYRDSGYRPYLAELLGMTIDNQGDGSAHWYWYNNTDNILYNVTNYTGYSDKDVCIIEGCVNDWAASRALGTYKDTGTDSVCGCLYNMISYVYSQKSGIQIIVILDHFGRVNGSTDTSSSALNNDNKTQYDFYEECAKLCEFYGIPCIKEYALSSIGIFGTEYLSDNIHLNTLGAQQSAQTIASVMMNIKPKKVSS